MKGKLVFFAVHDAAKILAVAEYNQERRCHGNQRVDAVKRCTKENGKAVQKQGVEKRADD